ncbi:putative NAD(P)-binding-domain-containing protein [Lipomyces orientalis]|uniref:NAD(P)-binding-domain-containing protein n=1 Tax=Lipomyces orientalis TaxID=1233043 RepID=A0ACC3TQE4_9ASCO
MRLCVITIRNCTEYAVDNRLSDLEDQKFADIPGGGSLVVAWQVKGKPVIVVGGGDVATGRVAHLLAADAVVTVICPSSGLSPELQYRVSRKQVSHISRTFDIELDLRVSVPSMVLVAIDSPSTSTEIYTECKKLKIPVNVADVPGECDFYFGSMYRDGPLQIMVSTNGNGPKMASLVRRRIEEDLKEEPFGLAIEKLGELRRRVREKVPGSGKGDMRKRMRWVSQISEQWTIAQLAKLDDDMIAKVIDYINDEPPSYEQLILITS